MNSLHDTIPESPRRPRRGGSPAVETPSYFPPSVPTADSGPHFDSTEAPAVPYAELSHYRILETLGRGGFGIVVKAYDRKLERPAAIKLMTSEFAATTAARQRFLREARAAAGVRHENVVHIYAVEESPVPYLVMEYVPGTTLQKHVEERGPFAVEDVLRIGARIARGLAAAHAAGLIHRDVKPANVLFHAGESPCVKLADFGLARAADDAAATSAGMVAGTPMYMAPEQARGENPDHRSDLFSLGSVLYFLVTGKPPFEGTSSRTVMRLVAEESPTPIAVHRPETPAWLVRIIEILQARDPNRRYADAVETARVLERSLAALRLGAVVGDVEASRRDLGLVAASVPGMPGRGRRRFRRDALLAAGLGLLAAAPFALTRLHPSEPAGDRKLQVAADPGAAAPPPRPSAKQLGNRVTGAVRKLNPQFDKEIRYFVVQDAVIAVQIPDGQWLIDPEPFRALIDLKHFHVHNADFENFEFLRGLPLREIEITETTTVRDLSALKGMPLERLTVWGFRGTDLTPLAGMNLVAFNCGRSAVRDLTPLAGMPLETFCMNHSEVTDIAVLRGMPLTSVSINNTHVADLTPIAGMKLTQFSGAHARIGDYGVLWDMPLTSIELDYRPAVHRDRLGAMESLGRINGIPVGAFFVPAR